MKALRAVKEENEKKKILSVDQRLSAAAAEAEKMPSFAPDPTAQPTTLPQSEQPDTASNEHDNTSQEDPPTTSNDERRDDVQPSNDDPLQDFVSNGAMAKDKNRPIGNPSALTAAEGRTSKKRHNGVLADRRGATEKSKKKKETVENVWVYTLDNLGKAISSKGTVNIWPLAYRDWNWPRGLNFSIVTFRSEPIPATGSKRPRSTSKELLLL